MKSLSCKLGIHTVEFITIVYDMDTEILQGSMAALVSSCTCGKVTKVSDLVPVYTLKYKLPEREESKTKEEGESNG